MLQLQPTKIYRLIDVLDHSGCSKRDLRELYRQRVGCFATGLEIRPVVFLDMESGDKPVNAEAVSMIFFRDSEGQPTKMSLITSPVTQMTESGSILRIRTRNSVYILEEVDPICVS